MVSMSNHMSGDKVPTHPQPLTLPTSPHPPTPNTLIRMDSQQSTQTAPTARRGAPTGNQNARTHGFYSSRLTEKDQDSLPDAVHLKGLQGEIGLLRLKIRRSPPIPTLRRTCCSEPSTLSPAPWKSMRLSITSAVARNVATSRLHPSNSVLSFVEGACPEPAEGKSDLFSHISARRWSVLALELDITSETIRFETQARIAPSSTPPVSPSSRLTLSPTTEVLLNRPYDSCTIYPPAMVISVGMSMIPSGSTAVVFPAGTTRS